MTRAKAAYGLHELQSSDLVLDDSCALKISKCLLMLSPFCTLWVALNPQQHCKTPILCVALHMRMGTAYGRNLQMTSRTLTSPHLLCSLRITSPPSDFERLQISGIWLLVARQQYFTFVSPYLTTVFLPLHEFILLIPRLAAHKGASIPWVCTSGSIHEGHHT